MSEEQQTQEASKNQSAGHELPDDIKAKLDELERLKSHHSKLLDETKRAKQMAQELEEAQRKAEEDRLKKEGEFQKLYESEAEKAARIQRELEEERENWRKERQERQKRDIQSESIKLMHEVAVDEPSLEILAEKAEKFAVYTENGIEYEIGGVKVDKAKVVETLATKYPRLVKGSGATGGGATGGARGGASKTGKIDGDKSERAAYFATKFNL